MLKICSTDQDNSFYIVRIDVKNPLSKHSTKSLGDHVFSHVASSSSKPKPAGREIRPARVSSNVVRDIHS